MGFFPGIIGALILINVFGGDNKTFTQKDWAEFAIGTLLIVVAVIFEWMEWRSDD